MNLFRTIIAVLCAVLFSQGSLGAATPPLTVILPKDGVRDVATLKRGELATLPGATMVRLPNSGRIVSVAQLLKEHDARMARFANVKARAAALAARLHFSPRLTLALGGRFRPIGNPLPAPIPTINPGVLQSHLGQYIAATTPQLLPVETSNGGVTFAKDYDDYCTVLKASVCIYFPADMVATYPNQEVYSDGTAPSFADSDYLVTQQQCSAGYGVWAGDASNYRCDYMYPAQSFVRWTETTPPTTTVSGTCLGDDGNAIGPYVETYDHYGVLEMTFVGGVSPSEPCILQVYAVPT